MCESIGPCRFFWFWPLTLFLSLPVCCQILGISKCLRLFSDLNPPNPSVAVSFCGTLVTKWISISFFGSSYTLTLFILLRFVDCRCLICMHSSQYSNGLTYTKQKGGRCTIGTEMEEAKAGKRGSWS